MTTLRREVRKIIEKTLDENIRYWEGRGDNEDLGGIASDITDKILDLPFFKKKENKDDKTNSA